MQNLLNAVDAIDALDTAETVIIITVVQEVPAHVITLLNVFQFLCPQKVILDVVVIEIMFVLLRILLILI